VNCIKEGQLMRMRQRNELFKGVGCMNLTICTPATTKRKTKSQAKQVLSGICHADVNFCDAFIHLHTCMSNLRTNLESQDSFHALALSPTALNIRSSLARQT
jgi:hypothetical protein